MLRKAYSYMYYELISNRLDVVLVPSIYEDVARDGGKIRAVVSKNPQWYQELCSRYVVQSRRKNKRTILRRIDVERILSRLKDGKHSRSKYVSDLQEIAESINKDLNLSDFEMQFLLDYGELPEPFTEQF